MESTVNSKIGISKKKGSFTKALLNVLEITHYEGASALSKPDRLHKIEVYESYDYMKSFIEWFTQCVSEDNCVTKQELLQYNELKKAGELVPVFDLDAVIGSFCQDTSSTILTDDLVPAIDAARKELEALESLENFLKEHEKNEKKKPKINNEDLDDAISAALNDLDELNTQFNDTLVNVSTAWHDLRSSYQQQAVDINRFESKDTSAIVAKINKLGKKIEENINYHLINDFKEVLPTQGVLDVTPKEYWLVFNRLEEVRNEILKTVSKQEGISLYKDCLQHLESSVNQLNISTFEEISAFLHVSLNHCSRIKNSLSDALKNERDCITSFQLEDAQKATTYLTDRLERLTKIEYILRQKKLHSHALTFVMKRNLLISNFQLEKLQEILEKIESYYKNFESRMNFMKDYKPKREEVINQYHKNMMNDLNVKDMSLTTLDAAISELHAQVENANETLYRKLELFQSNVLKRLNVSKEKKTIIFDGPTIEAFSKIFTDFIEVLQPKKENLTAIKKKKDKISKMFEEIAFEGQTHLKKDCIWLKCLNDPEFFITVQKMEAKLESLTHK